MDVDWWKRLEALASEGVKYMKPFVHAPYARFDLNESGKLLFDDFKTGRLSAEETLVATAGLVTTKDRKCGKTDA